MIFIGRNQTIVLFNTHGMAAMVRWIMIFLFALAILLFVVAFVVTRIENSQYAENKSYKDKWSGAELREITTAIVVFSRSGNTGVLADHIANKTDGDVYEILAEKYQLGIPGLISALNDARGNVAEISPAQIDLTQYDTVYLGSPIWLYSPAPPLWQFVENNDFTNKNVVLFNTFNSKFEQHFIDEFEALVRSNGAINFTHQYVKRGRMGGQISSQELTQRFDEKYDNESVSEIVGDSDEQQ